MRIMADWKPIDKYKIPEYAFDTTMSYGDPAITIGYEKLSSTMAYVHFGSASYVFSFLFNRVHLNTET